MRKTVLIAMMALVSIGLFAGAAGQAQMKPKMEGGMMMTMTPSAVDLGKAMRMLWEDHVMYTREYIISALAGLEDAQAVAERLLKNQDEIGNAVKPYYGDQAGAKLTSLLRDHILIAVEVVKAAKAGVAADLTAASKKWTANADELAAFLSGANPHWPRTEMTDMLHKHLDLTTQEVVSRLKKNWAGDIAAYDQGNAHMMKFADILTGGIVAQFPAKFKS